MELVRRVAACSPRLEPVAKAVARHARSAHGNNEVLYDSPEAFFDKPPEDNDIVIPAEKTGFFSKLFGR